MKSTKRSRFPKLSYFGCRHHFGCGLYLCVAPLGQLCRIPPWVAPCLTMSGSSVKRLAVEWCREQNDADQPALLLQTGRICRIQIFSQFSRSIRSGISLYQNCKPLYLCMQW